MDDTNDDYVVKNYQDSLDTDQNVTDPLMNELNDDIVETLGVPADKLRDELNKRDFDNPNTTDDMRAEIEDLDEDQNERT